MPVRPSPRSRPVTLLLLALLAVVAPLASAIDIAIVATFGTRSDVAPLFEGLIDFARQPGNTITYVAARGIAERHASQFSYVKTHLIDALREPAYLSPNHTAIASVVQTRTRIDNTQLFLDGIGHIVDVYEDNAAAFLQYFRSHRYDLVLCDAVEQACMDVAKETGHKLAIYGPLGQYGVGADWYIPDFLAPVPMEQLIASPWLRAKGYLDLIPFIVATLQARWKIQAAQERLGFTVPFTEPWEYPQKHLMLAHHVLGVDPARNVPSNIHVFGPVVNEENIPAIEPETKAALDALHADGVRVVAIALGSVFTLKDSPELYDAMMTSIEQLISDESRKLAVLWPCKWHDAERVHRLQTQYPGRLLTPQWITMRRALMHDAVQLFLNQAGYASMTEANGQRQGAGHAADLLRPVPQHGQRREHRARAVAGQVHGHGRRDDEQDRDAARRDGAAQQHVQRDAGQVEDDLPAQQRCRQGHGHEHRHDGRDRRHRPPGAARRRPECLRPVPGLAVARYRRRRVVAEQAAPARGDRDAHEGQDSLSLLSATEKERETQLSNHMNRIPRTLQHTTYLLVHPSRQQQI
ncbi:hypothetical protein PINS_up009613 [Pythium insidiosum]|nr:hypothetical protein PINS_up009613 [Pythium insidiosum]